MKTNIIYRGLYCYLFHPIIAFIWCPKYNYLQPSYGHTEVRMERKKERDERNSEESAECWGKGGGRKGKRKKIVQNECRKSEDLVS
jgi:hypothetical protein